MAQNWAICVGINGYEFMPPLRYAENDALAMAEFFRAAHFQRVDTFTDSSPPIEDGKRSFKSQPTYTRLKWFLRDCFTQPFLQPGDNLWFFFSGHGVNYQDRDYLLAIDSDAHPAGIEETAIPISDVAARLRRSGATNVILILDACRNEQGSKGAGLSKIHEPGIITLMSCSRGEKSYEIEVLEQGAFTYALRESLALTGEKNCATVERLYKRVRERVKTLNTQDTQTRQTPYASVEPPEKFYTILLPRQATGQDIQQYKTCAYRAETEGNLQQAHAYWDMLLEISPGDQEVKRKFLKLGRKLEELSASSSKPVVPMSDVGDKTPQGQRTQQDPKPVVSKPTERPIFEASNPRPSKPQTFANTLDQVELKSTKGVDYRELRELLRRQAWKEADQETRYLMLEMSDRQHENSLRVVDIKKFPCEDLRTINELWTIASNYHFGFSVQKKIWQRVGGKVDYPTECQLGKAVGWIEEGLWLKYSSLTFSSDAPRGHLPILFEISDYEGFRTKYFIYRMANGAVLGSSLASRLVNCNL